MTKMGTGKLTTESLWLLFSIIPQVEREKIHLTAKNNPHNKRSTKVVSWVIKVLHLKAIKRKKRLNSNLIKKV